MTDEPRGLSPSQPVELRTIPKNWQHPTDGTRHLPLSRWEMPDVSQLPEEETMIVAYETLTGGSPISPPFANSPDGQMGLVEHCARHCGIWVTGKLDADGWADALFGQRQ